MRHVASTEGLSSSTLRALRDYWLGARGPRRMPARQDIDPLHIPRLLRHLMLTDVVHDPLRFRYRLIGTYVTELTGRDATGRWLDAELYGERTEDLLWAFRQCVAQREPLAKRERLEFASKDWVAIEVLLLPVGAVDEHANLVLAGIDAASPENATPPPPDTAFLLDWRLG